MPDPLTANLVIRTAQHADLPTVIDLCAQHAAFEGAEFNSAGLLAGLALAIAGSPPRLRVFLAEIAAVPVGYAAITREYSTWSAKEYLHMDCLYVIASERGRYTGHTLFDAVRHYAIDAGIDALQWQTPDWNHDAIRFYHSLGAVSKAKQRFTFDLLK